MVGEMMKSNSTSELIKNLRRKGILFSNGDKILFENNDYFQVVNAYKGLFIQNVENIDDIINNINNSTNIDLYKTYFNIKSYNDNDDFENKVCNKIIEKYGLTCADTYSLQDKIKLIKKINYIHHIYKPTTFYKDFVRLYDFEHELRNLLLKYVLTIEENIKKIFIATLNNLPKDDRDANYLANINNYDTSRNNRNKSIESLKKVIDIYGNHHSKPIARKRDQDLIVPYWILINEMSMNQTLSTINNLNEHIKYKIMQKCLSSFTNCNNVDIFDKTKDSQTIEDERKLINAFSNVLKNIGYFRNLLAHNQPIFNYNVKDSDYSRFPNFTYELPKTDSRPDISIVDQQHRINASQMGKMKEFFGTDFFNSRSTNINIDLSWIIYVTKKIIDHIDQNNIFKEELNNVYMKYNICISYSDLVVENPNTVETLLEMIKNIDIEYLNTKLIIEKIENSGSYKLAMKRNFKEIKDKIKEIKKKSKEIKIDKKVSKYKPFLNSSEYTKYTNINANFLKSI